MEINQDLKIQIEKAKELLIEKGSKQGTIIGWIMILSVLVQAWDYFSSSYVMGYLIFEFHPSSAILGTALAGPFIGGAFGAMLGGYLIDKYGRRAIFIGDMIAMTVFAALQAFVPNMTWLATVRILLGVPLGIDIPIAFTYIMELLPSGRREIMGNAYQLAYALGLVIAAIGAVFLILSSIAFPY